MWEHEWKHAKRNNPAVIAFMSTYKHPERLKLRDSLFGGRTNTYNLYYKVKDSERIRYIHFASLYPFCQARKNYPIGHPQIILKDFKSLENYYGLIKATVYRIPHEFYSPFYPTIVMVN